MLIYEKKVDGEKHLFGTEANIPSDEDTQLTYEDNAGEEIDDIKDYTFFYEDGGIMFGNESKRQLPADDDVAVNVWMGEMRIIPHNQPEAEAGEE